MMIISLDAKLDFLTGLFVGLLVGEVSEIAALAAAAVV